MRSLKKKKAKSKIAAGQKKIRVGQHEAPIEQALLLANSHRQAGQVQQAEKIYQEILRKDLQVFLSVQRS